MRRLKRKRLSRVAVVRICVGGGELSACLNCKAATRVARTPAKIVLNSGMVIGSDHINLPTDEPQALCNGYTCF